MQIIQKIAAWAAEQPAWIDDAVRRLVAGSLTAEDCQELSALAKAEHFWPAPATDQKFSAPALTRPN